MANKKGKKKEQESSEQNEQVLEAEFVNVTAQEERASENAEAQSENTEEKKSIKIEFPYSDLVRGQAPQVFDFAEKVATDWLNNGEFKDLPIKQPLAQYFVGEGLRKAKDVEKKVANKLNETGVTYIVKSQFEFLKSKLKK